MKIKIIDIYGDEWDYDCNSKAEAKECFIAENGEDRFESFLTNKNEDYIQ